MARFIWCEIVCAGCAGVTAGRHVRGAIPRRAMYDDAKRAGWKYKHDPHQGQDDWFCGHRAALSPAKETP